jgi:hypothetical protein
MLCAFLLKGPRMRWSSNECLSAAHRTPYLFGGNEMKRLCAIALIALMLTACGNGDGNGTPGDAADTTTPPADTTTPLEDTTSPPVDTGTADTTPPPDIPLPPPDTGSADTADGKTAVVIDTCRLGIECALDCNKEADCEAACTVDAGEAIQVGVGDVLTCYHEECPNGGYQCVWDQCYDSYHLCYFAGKTGDKNCKDIVDCLQGCSDNDCVDTCLQAGNSEDQLDFLKLKQCVKEQCGSEPSEECKKQAELNICGVQYNECLGDIG